MTDPENPGAHPNGTPDAEAPSIGTPDDVASSMGSPEAGARSIGTPDDAAPSMGTPDAGASSLGTPDDAASSLGTPDDAAPSMGTPDAGAASLGTPDDAASSLGTPDAGASPIGAPRAGAAHAGLPPTDTPPTGTPPTGTPHAGTPHIRPEGVEIAPTVLLPGDPLRARFIAETYLDDAVPFNTVRNMLGFTGAYRGTPVSVMGTGMGIPSIGIYAHELIHEFGAMRLIRVGTCGGLHPDLELLDVVLAQGASTDSNFMSQYGLPGTFAPLASFGLLRRAADAADELGLPVRVGNVVSSDVFYSPEEWARAWQRMGVLAIEMEAAGLYATAAEAGVEALAVLTVSDLVLREGSTTPAERETAFTRSMELALALV